MDNTNYLLERIHLHIPEEILVIGFNSYTNRGMFSIDYAIKEQIVFGIVLKDCCLFSGKIKKIELQEDFVQRVSQQPSIIPYGAYSLYKIPEEYREHQPITYAIDISYPITDIYPYTTPIEGTSGSLQQLADNSISSYTGYGNAPKPLVTATPPDIIKLTPPQMTHVNWLIACIIGYDQSFTNISPGLLQSLSKMCVEATKMWLYKNLIIKIDQGLLVGGKELGKFKDIIESYTDANEKYEEYLMDFRGASQFDNDSLVEWVSLMV